MAGSSDKHETVTESSSTVGSTATTMPAPTSPTRSDKSSDSEGKPVREKLKETRIDAQTTSDPVSGSDQPMDGVPNGSAQAADSASGSDNERGRLRRKRSREDFENDTEGDKHPEKKQEKEERHHTRKRSRDVKDIESGFPLKPTINAVAPIAEHDTDEHMTSLSQESPEATASMTNAGTDTSVKTKRTRDQVEEGTDLNHDGPATSIVTNGKTTLKANVERETKRLRDEDAAQATTDAPETRTKIPPTSGFANTSAASPFATMTPKPQAQKSSDRPGSLPQTSEDKFKASGFGTFSSSAASPFGGLTKTSASKSPFAAASVPKLSSFAGIATPSAAPTSGFGALGNSTKSAFGGSSFGGALGGGFGGLSGAKPAQSSFATPSSLTITGLKTKLTAFGTPANKSVADDASDEEGGDEDETEKDNTEEERRSSQPLLSQQPHETGEEGETTAWTGRAKLYTMAGEGPTRAWQERGVGTFKFNVTVDEPKKARFVLRADGTHRLLLNAAVTKQLIFGGDSGGEKPKDGRLLFNTPTADGQLEMHLLKLKAERAVELWDEVVKVQDADL